MSYKEIKAKCPEAICLVRVGDFYEIYKEDAPKAAETLGITLTKVGDLRASLTVGLLPGIKVGDYLCGFPHHALDRYLPMLIRAGHRVAILEKEETVAC